LLHCYTPALPHDFLPLSRPHRLIASARFRAHNCSPTRSCTLLRRRRTRVRLPAPPLKPDDLAEAIVRRIRVARPGPRYHPRDQVRSSGWRQPREDLEGQGWGRCKA
jgi:hypothetical protein